MTTPRQPRPTTAPLKRSPSSSRVRVRSLAVRGHDLEGGDGGRQVPVADTRTVGRGRRRPDDRDVRQRAGVVQRQTGGVEGAVDVAEPDAGRDGDAAPCSRSTTTSLLTSARDTRVSWLSAMVLNECRLPSTRSRLAAATVSWSCSTLAGCSTRGALNTTLPDQLVPAPSTERPAGAGLPAAEPACAVPAPAGPAAGTGIDVTVGPGAAGLADTTFLSGGCSGFGVDRIRCRSDSVSIGFGVDRIRSRPGLEELVTRPSGSSVTCPEVGAREIACGTCRSGPILRPAPGSRAAAGNGLPSGRAGVPSSFPQWGRTARSDRLSSIGGDSAPATATGSSRQVKLMPAVSRSYCGLSHSRSAAVVRSSATRVSGPMISGSANSASTSATTSARATKCSDCSSFPEAGLEVDLEMRQPLEPPAGDPALGRRRLGRHAGNRVDVVPRPRGAEERVRYGRRPAPGSRRRLTQTWPKFRAAKSVNRLTLYPAPSTASAFAAKASKDRSV